VNRCTLAHGKAQADLDRSALTASWERATLTYAGALACREMSFSRQAIAVIQARCSSPVPPTLTARYIRILNLREGRLEVPLLASRHLANCTGSELPTMEHRCGSRRTVSSAVIVRSHNGIAAKGSISDISASGALVRSSLPVPLHGIVLLQFLDACHEPGRRRALVVGEIVRHTKDGFAVEWAIFSPEVVRSLLRQATGELTPEPASATPWPQHRYNS
jgi:PilZ domain-containing protein